MENFFRRTQYIVVQAVYLYMRIDAPMRWWAWLFHRFMWKEKKSFFFCVENKNKIVKLFERFVVCRKIVRQHHHRRRRRRYDIAQPSTADSLIAFFRLLSLSPSIC